ncbi:MAG: L,D-transpeptidase, partial [Pseudomonadota bacterium]
MRQVIGHEGHSRRWLLKAGAAFAGMAMATSAFPALASTGRSKNMILDEFTGEWVDYNPRAAYRYYRSNGDVPPVFRRQLVPFKSNEKPGTIIVDGNRHFLYLIQEGGMAMRYGIGVGKEGFGWSGIVRVGRT